MNIFTKSAVTVFAAASMTSIAMASPGDGSYGANIKSQADIAQLTSEIQQLGAQPASGVNVSNAHTLTEKSKLLNAKKQGLKLQLKELKNQNH